MTQVKAEKTKEAGGKKLTLRKETLRDLKAGNAQTQQVKGGIQPKSNSGMVDC